MTWTFGSDLAAWLPAARAAVAARPVVNTLLLTVMEGLERGGPNAYGPGTPLFGSWTGPGGRVTGAVLRTPPHPLLVGALPREALPALGAALAAEPLFAGVDALNARRADAEVLASAWGRPTTVCEENRLYRLGGLRTPDPAPAGRPRRATGSDLPLLRDWTAAFHREAGLRGAVPEALLRDRLSYGGTLLWEDGGGPVSMAGFHRPVARVAHVARVGPVYTPPAHRGRGYGAGVTHAVSEAAYAAGAAEVLLFTDLANPTSNGVYRRLGYVPVEDRTELLAT
ncbi:GNAT family N-acetyltransferase [Streptomyces sp. ISL-66]|uniref:GNAT family N-acetyltransferase n=1 Tax=Streptomyces sp. ISL-66 TaxID=2819186 RepID=UPI001BE9E147|nr:GNAT family N-acetyltransferase [Streptomyces sp. ISL-66]MBT2471362.1 GNAT family N-acetyltransferase [Streptomyces sp. ISL-66]